LWVRVHDIDKDYWPIASWAPPPLIDAPAAALYYAALCGFRGLVDRLLTKYPQHIHAMGGVHGTALHAASRGNHCEVAQAIVGRGGDVNVRGHCGKTPLHVASSAGHLGIARWLLHHGAAVNAQDDERRHPLHVLVHEARLETPVQSQPSDTVFFPKVRDHHGGTSDLGSRQRAQPVEVARLLLEHGVNVDAKDRTGQTVGEIAWARRYQDVMYQDIMNLLRDSSHNA
jgi:ankyrin repeat protein